MLELPEVLTLAKQLGAEVAGAGVERVLPPTKAHKFCWYSGDPTDYDARLHGRAVASAQGFGSYAELVFDDGSRLCVNDGVNIRLVVDGGLPKDYQLAIRLSDGRALAFTVAMYGGIQLHGGDLDNEYYRKSRDAVSPFSPAFDAHYRRTLAEGKPTLSAKAALATGQRFPGIGNGVLQDILFAARVHPKRKLATLGDEDRAALLDSVKGVLRAMTDGGGRDTERDLYGAQGGYRTIMSKTGALAGCPACGGAIAKEAYMGGSVYYCPRCQPLPGK